MNQHLGDKPRHDPCEDRDSPLMTVAEAAKYLTLSEPQLYLMMARKEIPYIQLSKRRKALRRKHLDEWLESKTEKVQ